MPDKKKSLPWIVMGLLAAACLTIAMPGQIRKGNGDSRPQQNAGPPEGAASPQREDATVDPSQYVGAETCKTCHEEEAASYDQGPHGKLAPAKHQEAGYQGCEACHGPGKAHAESADPDKIVRFAGLSREASSERCLKCHEFGREHASFLRSGHIKHDVGCLDCHSAHTPGVREHLLKAAQPQLCYGCHGETKPDSSKPFHHKVNEGSIACGDCHGLHGGLLTPGPRSTAAVCFVCHADKAGPFVFEHAPVEGEGCVACHSLHGSSNPRLLRRSPTGPLCRTCHTFTANSAAVAPFHDQERKSQACASCHVAIHGSNTNRLFFTP